MPKRACRWWSRCCRAALARAFADRWVSLPFGCVAAECVSAQPSTQVCISRGRCAEKRITVSLDERLHRWVQEAATKRPLNFADTRNHLCDLVSTLDTAIARQVSIMERLGSGPVNVPSVHFIRLHGAGAARCSAPSSTAQILSRNRNKCASAAVSVVSDTRCLPCGGNPVRKQ